MSLAYDMVPAVSPTIPYPRKAGVRRTKPKNRGLYSAGSRCCNNDPACRPTTLLSLP